MMKLKKSLIALSVTAIMALASVGVYAFADYNASDDVIDEQNSIAQESPDATFMCTEKFATITNNTSINRYMEAHITVYDKKTNKLITEFSRANTGGKNANAQANNNTYGLDGHYFLNWGDMYNSTAPQSGVFWSSGIVRIN